MTDDPTRESDIATLLRDEPIPAPQGEVQDRVRARLAHVIPEVGAAGRTLHRRETLPASGGAHAVMRLALVFAAGAAAGGSGAWALKPDRAPQIVYVERAVATDAGPIDTPAPPSAVAPPAPPASAAPPPRAVQATPVPSAAAADTLRAERHMLDDARRALTAGDAAGALARLDEHAARFPHGQLGEEREALAVQALVIAGRYEEARARADALRARSPNSVYLPAVDVALRSIP